VKAGFSYWHKKWWESTEDISHSIQNFQLLCGYRILEEILFVRTFFLSKKNGQNISEIFMLTFSFLQTILLIKKLDSQYLTYFKKEKKGNLFLNFKREYDWNFIIAIALVIFFFDTFLKLKIWFHCMDIQK
jgi:hypothetical protein